MQTHIDLSGRGLKSLRDVPEFAGVDYIRSIDISHNNLESLDWLPRCDRLIASHNHLTKVGRHFHDADFSHNKLKEIRGRFTTINVSNNPLKSIKIDADYITMENCDLSSIPSIEAKVLDVSFNPLGKLSAMKVSQLLIASACELQLVETSADNIDVSNNIGLSTIDLPRHVKGDLNVSGCMLRELISVWDVGGTLDISRNPGIVNCSVLKVKNLIALDCSLQTIPVKVTVHADVSNNDIQDLTGCVENTSIIADNNRLTDLTGCPKRMRRVQITGNPMVSLHGSPKIVAGDFIVTGRFRSLRGPKVIGGKCSISS